MACLPTGMWPVTVTVWLPSGLATSVAQWISGAVSATEVVAWLTKRT